MPRDGLRVGLNVLRRAERGRRALAWMRRSVLLGPAALLALSLVPATLAGEPLRVLVVIDEEQAAYRQLIESALREVGGNGNGRIALQAVNLAAPPSVPGALPPADLYVAAGTRAAAEMAKLADRTPLLCVLIPRLSFEGLFPPATRNGSGRVRSAIYVDQPVARQLDLIRALMPDSRDIGVAIGPATQGYAEEMNRVAAGRGLRLHVQLITPQLNLVRELDQLLPESDVLLGLVDPLVFNRANAQKILLTAYRHRVPLVGVSPGYVRAGALAAVYSSPEQIGRQLGAYLAGVDRAKLELPEPQYPSYFSVTVNQSVAASLGIASPDEGRLAHRLGATP